MVGKGGVCMTLKRPFFLSNKEWYYEDDESGTFKLTEKATPEAIKSYNEFYAELNRPERR
jgi:hypothetical protein